VTLTSLEEARRLAREAADRAHKALAPLGGKTEFLDELAEYLVTRDR
jgi:geranylgeranyl diphosphate synthase type II